MPLVAVVVVEVSRSAVHSIGRICPSRGIQDELFIGIDAVTVEVRKEQRLARNAVGVGSLERVGTQDVISGGRGNRQSAGVAKDSAEGPVSEGGFSENVMPDRGYLVSETGRKNQRLGERRNIFLHTSVEYIVDRAAIGAGTQFLLPCKRGLQGQSMGVTLVSLD